MNTLEIRLRRNVARLLTGRGLQQLRRRRAGLMRRLRGEAAQVHYFHQADDPYSALCLPLLPRLAERYRIVLVPHLVPGPSEAAAPDRERLADWSRRDAGLLAHALGMATAPFGAAPAPDQVARAEAAFTAALREGRFVERAGAIDDALWRGEPVPGPFAGAAEVEAERSASAALRRRMGHYLGAVFAFGGETYWGADRLHYLESRLREEGLCKEPSAALLAVPPALRFISVDAGAASQRPVLHWFCSFRSPYTWLSAQRVQRLATHYGAELRIRYVLPMVMRGLPVPREKRMYILADAAREARRLGVPFGDIVDPVGRPVERGYAVLQHAIAAGRGFEFARSFLQGAWSEGVDAGRDAGLAGLARRAGFDEAFVAVALRDEGWREVAAANRAELLAMGLWGVPSFRVDDGPGRWGQDRLWAVEDDLLHSRGGG